MLAARCLPFNLQRLWPNVRAIVRFHTAGMYLQLPAVSLADFSAIATANPIISPALLGRARSVAAEHGKLAQQLSVEYDTEVAKKVGELSTTVKALEDWELASSVCRIAEIKSYDHLLIKSYLVTRRTPTAATGSLDRYRATLVSIRRNQEHIR